MAYLPPRTYQIWCTFIWQWQQLEPIGRPMHHFRQTTNGRYSKLKRNHTKTLEWNAINAWTLYNPFCITNFCVRWIDYELAFSCPFSNANLGIMSVARGNFILFQGLSTPDFQRNMFLNLLYSLSTFDNASILLTHWLLFIPSVLESITYLQFHLQ